MKRYREIDLSRGIAIICMIVFHSVYLIVFTGFASIDLFSGFWWIFPRCIAATFLFLVGVSLVISHSRAKSSLSRAELTSKFVLRGLMIFGFGAVITAVTLVMSFVWKGMEKGYVLFGILHLIGLSIIGGFFLVRFKFVNLVLGLSIIAAGIVLGFFRFRFFWLMWLGLRPANYYPVDYLPLLPWAGYVCLGIFTGNVFYKDGKRSFPVPSLGDIIPVRFLSFLGRHSLLIYLLHIPLIFAILFGLKQITG
jgi:uncharacterized membrane protein